MKVLSYYSGTLIICIVAASNAPSLKRRSRDRASEIKMHLGSSDYRASRRVVKSQRSESF